MKALSELERSLECYPEHKFFFYICASGSQAAFGGSEKKMQTSIIFFFKFMGHNRIILHIMAVKMKTAHIPAAG